MKLTGKRFIITISASLLSLTTVWAGQAALPPAPLKQTTASAPAAESAEAKRNRKQAYLRYIEAQRMKTSRTTKVSDLVTIYKEIIQLDPSAADPHAELGEVYAFYMRQVEAGEREGQEAIRLDPNGVNGHRLLARLHMITMRLEACAVNWLRTNEYLLCRR